MTDSEIAGTPSRWLWVLAALVALALHAGGAALAITQLQTDDVEDQLGSQAIEIGLEMSAPRSEPTDLPPGPDSDAAVASPEIAEQKAVVEQTDLPKAMPTESEQPDRVVTQQEPTKPEEKEPEVAAVQATASTESVASEATAMPSSEVAPEAPRSVAPAQGSGDSARKLRTSWQRELVAHLDRHKRYPGGRPQKSAEIVVSFELDRLGRVVSVKIVKGSGDAAFDDAALAMVRRADPVPVPPPLVADEGLSFSLPVIFRVKGRG